MPDVGSQLAEYFEAATERIAADDVLAQVRVCEELRPAPRRLRPASAVAAGFAGALLLVGGALLAGWLLHDPGSSESGPVAAPAAEPGAALAWWPVVLAAVVLVLGTAAVVVRLRGATKEVDMQTLEKTPQEATDRQVHALRRKNRWLVVALALVVVVAAVAIGWLIAENRSLSSEGDSLVLWPDESQLTARQQEMVGIFADDGPWLEAIRTGDVAAAIALYSPSARVIFEGSEYRIGDGSWQQWLEALGATPNMEVAGVLVAGNSLVMVTRNGDPQTGQFAHLMVFTQSGDPLIHRVTISGER
jgi:hypothetical protein